VMDTGAAAIDSSPLKAIVAARRQLGQSGIAKLFKIVSASKPIDSSKRVNRRNINLTLTTT
jgi:hypothetical protein